MTEISEIMLLLNPWWKTGQIGEDLTRKYRRKIFTQAFQFLTYRHIVILSGLRRIGKTTILYQLIETILQANAPTKVLYFNFDRRVEELVALLEIYQTQTNVDWKHEKIYVFLDEITKLEGWASQIKLIYDAFPHIKFVVSSSSSVGLEKEAAVNLAGRYFMINLQPLSFLEYLELQQKQDYLNNNSLWKKELALEAQRYLWRSFPETMGWQDEAVIKDYLRTAVLDKILREDLPQKFKNVEPDLLLTLLQNFYHEPGMYIDYDSLATKLRIGKKKLIQHIFYLEFSYLIRRVKNLRVSVMATSRKMQRIYPYWWNMAYIYGNNFDKIMENVVVSIVNSNYYWRKGGKEVDALEVREKNILPIEVKNKSELDKHDFKSLKYFMHTHALSRAVVVYNGEEIEVRFGDAIIRCVPLWKWMLERD